MAARAGFLFHWRRDRLATATPAAAAATPVAKTATG